MDQVVLAVEKFKYLLDQNVEKLYTFNNQVSLSSEPHLLKRLYNNEICYKKVLTLLETLAQNEFTNLFNQFKEIIEPKLPLPIKYESNHKYYRYLKGTTPWDFVLSNDCFDDMEEIDNDIIKSYCFEKLEQSKYIPDRGTIVLGSTGTTLYRALCICQTSHSTCKLLNIDTGKYEIASLDQLYKIPKLLMTKPPQTIRCSLANDRFCERYWNNHYKEWFISIMKQLKFSFKIVEQISLHYPPHFLIKLNGHLINSESEYTVDLSNWFFDVLFPTILKCGGDFKLVNSYVPDPFVECTELPRELNLSSSSSSSEEFYYSEEQECPEFTSIYPIPGQNHVINVCLQTIVTAHIFYAQLIDYDECFYESYKIIEQEMNTPESIETFKRLYFLPTTGGLCLALGENKRWFRSRIISVDEKGVHVYNVDNGRIETVSFSNLRRIKQEYLEVPAQAIRCVLYGITPIENKRRDAENFVNNFIRYKTFVAHVKRSNIKDRCIEISLLLPNGKTIEDIFIDLGFYHRST